MGERSSHKSPSDYTTRHGLARGMARLSKKREQEDIAAWDEVKTRMQGSRRNQGIFDFTSEDTENLKVISEAQAKLETCVVPFMPCIPEDG